MKKKLAMVSPILRRDLHAPLRFFREFTVYHFYREASYGDMLPGDWQGNESRYTGAGDLRRQLEALHPALIQGSEPTWFPKTLPVCRVTAALAGAIPLYFPMLENKPLREKFGRLGGLAMNWYLARYAAKARLIYAVNTGAERTLLAAGVPPEKIKRRLYGTWGIDTEEFTPNPAVAREPLILFVGRLENEKGVWYLLDAFLNLRRRMPAARLELLGGGPLRKTLQSFLAQHRLESSVILRGVVPNRLLPAEFRRARITCVPSLSTRGWEEQVGMVNLQSLACGTPVVTTNTGANPEMISDGVSGKLVPEREGTALAAALEPLLNGGPAWEAMSAAGLAAVAERFDARKNIALIEQDLLAIL